MWYLLGIFHVVPSLAGLPWDELCKTQALSPQCPRGSQATREAKCTAWLSSYLLVSSDLVQFEAYSLLGAGEVSTGRWSIRQLLESKADCSDERV